MWSQTNTIYIYRKIQSVFELSDGSGLVVTVARYETPAHTNIDKVHNWLSLFQDTIHCFFSVFSLSNRDETIAYSFVNHLVS